MQRVGIGELQLVDFLNGYKIYVAYADTTMDDFFETLSEYVQLVAFVTAFPSVEGDLEFISIALDQFSVLVRVRENNPEAERGFTAFMRKLAAICDVFPGVDAETDLARIEDRFNVKFSRDRKLEGEREWLPPVYCGDQVRRMAKFMQASNLYYAKLWRLSYNDIRSFEDDCVSYDFLIWSVWYVSIGYMVTVKFYARACDIERKEALKKEESVEMNGDDLVIVRDIGVGGYGTVKACYHTKYHLLFAVKISRSSDERDLDKMKKEYEHMQRFRKHPCIIHAFGWVSCVGGKKRPGIVQEYAIYGSAYSLMNRVKISGYSRVGFYFDLLFAMRFMHGMGYVHRDFKMENFLIDDGFRAKLVDFGSCCTFEEANKSIIGNITLEKREIETKYNHEFTFHTDIGMLVRHVLGGEIADPLPYAIPGFDVHSVRSILVHFIRLFVLLFLSCPESVQSRVFENIKIHEAMKCRKDNQIMVDYIVNLWGKIEVTPNPKDSGVERTIAHLGEPWYESIDLLWNHFLTLKMNDPSKAYSMAYGLFYGLEWMTKKWGDKGREIRRMIRAISERMEYTQAEISIESKPVMFSIVTYVFQFCDSQEQLEFFPLLEKSFKLSQYTACAGPGVCLGLELLRQHRYHEAEEVLVQAIAIGKRAGHTLQMPEHDCWMLETGIWALAELRLTRELQSKCKEMLDRVYELCDIVLTVEGVYAVVEMFQQNPELLIWVVLVAGLDIDYQLYNVARIGELCTPVIMCVSKRPMRCSVTLIRWLDYLNFDLDFMKEKRNILHEWVTKQCVVANQIDQVSWPVISTEMWPELVWMRNQAIKYKIVEATL